MSSRSPSSPVKVTHLRQSRKNQHVSQIDDMPYYDLVGQPKVAGREKASNERLRASSFPKASAWGGGGLRWCTATACIEALCLSAFAQCLPQGGAKAVKMWYSSRKLGQSVSYWRRCLVHKGHTTNYPVAHVKKTNEKGIVLFIPC